MIAYKMMPYDDDNDDDDDDHNDENAGSTKKNCHPQPLNLPHPDFLSVFSIWVDTHFDGKKWQQDMLEQKLKDNEYEYEKKTCWNFCVKD